MHVWSLGWDDPLEKGMATHSSSLAWGIPWTEEPGGLQSIGSQRFGHEWRNLAAYPHNNPMNKSNHYPNFTDAESESPVVTKKKKKTCPWSNRKQIFGTIFESKMSSFRVCAFDHCTGFQSQTMWNVYSVKVSRISALAFIVCAGRKGMLSKK